MDSLTAKQLSVFLSQLENQQVYAKFNEHFFEISGIEFVEGEIHFILSDQIEKE